MFPLIGREAANLKSQFATSSWVDRRKLPLAFTRHGTIMTAAVLNTPYALAREGKGLGQVVRVIEKQIDADQRNSPVALAKSPNAHTRLA